MISGHRMSNWGQQPKSARMLGMSVKMERPFMTASPLVGASMPVRMEMAVVFPAPLWPARELQHVKPVMMVTIPFVQEALGKILTAASCTLEC